MAKKLKRFHILLDDESLLYFPGSFLTGKVLLELEEDTPATGQLASYSLNYTCLLQHNLYLNQLFSQYTQIHLHIGLYFHIIGEGVVRFSSSTKGKVLASDKENYIDFRMRLLGDGPVAKAGKSPDRAGNSFQPCSPIKMNMVIIGQIY